MDMSQKRDMILKGNLWKVIFTLALPIMLGNLIQTIYNLTDTFFVGKLGGNEVAAIQLVWPIIFLMMSFGMGMGIATTSLISQYIGANEHDKASKTAGQAISFLVILAIVLGTIGFFLSDTIVSLMGATGLFHTNASDFLKIMFIGLPGMFLMFAYNAIKQGQGDTMAPMKLSLVSVISNIIMDPIFIFVLGMGIRGAAIATVLARAIFSVIAIMTIFYRQKGIHLHLKDLKLQMESVALIVKVGLPSSLGQATAALGFTILNVFLVDFGQVTLTAFAIGNRISSLIMMPAMGIGNALAPLVGQNLGAENPQRAKSAIYKSMVISTVILLTGGWLMFPFRSFLIGLFTTDPVAIASGADYLGMIIIGIPLMGLFQIYNGTFQGSGHTVFAMILMMGRLWALRIPMVFYLSHQATFNPMSVWYAMIISNFITVLVGTGIFLSGKWQKRVIKKKAVTLAESE